MRKKERFSDISIHRIKERLDTPVDWFPFPAIISFFLIFILSEFLVFDLNYRLLSKAEVLAFPSESEYEGSIWISLSSYEDNLLITTDDKKVFYWPINSSDPDSKDTTKIFIEYLKTRKNEVLQTIGLSNLALSNQLMVVIAADQKLRFIHIRPILYALGEAGINQYAFETSLAITDPRLKQFESHREK